MLRVSATISTEGVIPLLQFPGQKPQLDPRPIDHSFYSLGCAPSVFSALRKMGCTALAGMGKEGDPFAGWVMVQEGMQRLWGQESNQ